MLAAKYGETDVVRLLIEAGASIEAKSNVSKRISICTCVCVCVIFLHHSVVLFYSYILLLWYIGYDDFISMNNVFVFVLIIIILLLVLLLANMKMNILEKSLFSISHKFLYISVFLHWCIFVSPLCTYIFHFLFSSFLSSGVFTFSLTLTLFLFLSFTLSVCWYFFLWFFLFLF